MNINPLKTVEQGRVIEIEIRSLVSRKTNMLSVKKTDNSNGTSKEVRRYIRALQVGLDDIWEAVSAVVDAEIEVIAFGTVEISPLGERHVIVFREKEEEG